MGNSFVQTIVDEAGLSTTVGEQLDGLFADSTQRAALFHLAELGPTSAQVDMMGALEQSDATPEEISQLGEQAASGAAPEGLEMLEGLKAANVPLTQLSEPALPSGDRRLPHQARMEQAFGEDLSDSGGNK